MPQQESESNSGAYRLIPIICFCSREAKGGLH